MRLKPILTAAGARQMLSAARAEADIHQWAVSIAAVDDGGHLLALERLDDEDAVKERPGLVTLPGVVRVQGGLPIKRASDWLGGVGVSGVVSHQDEQVAAAAIAALTSAPS